MKNLDDIKDLLIEYEDEGITPYYHDNHIELLGWGFAIILCEDGTWHFEGG